MAEDDPKTKSGGEAGRPRVSRDQRRNRRPGHGRRPAHDLPQRQCLLRRQAGDQERVGRHRPQRGDRHDRTLGLRQVHLHPLPEPHERHHRRLPGDRRDHPGRDQTSTTRTWMWCPCGPRWAWCSRSPTRFPSPFTTTWPMGRASTAWPATKAELDEIVETSSEGRACGTRSRTGWISPAPDFPAASSSGFASPAPLP